MTDEVTSPLRRRVIEDMTLEADRRDREAAKLVDEFGPAGGVITDAVQDVLLTVHMVRHAYDPSRPFGPWLLAIANRRIRRHRHR